MISSPLLFISVGVEKYVAEEPDKVYILFSRLRPYVHFSAHEN